MTGAMAFARIPDGAVTGGRSLEDFAEAVPMARAMPTKTTRSTGTEPSSQIQSAHPGCPARRALRPVVSAAAENAKQQHFWGAPVYHVVRSDRRRARRSLQGWLIVLSTRMRCDDGIGGEPGRVEVNDVLWQPPLDGGHERTCR